MKDLLCILVHFILGSTRERFLARLAKQQTTTQSLRSYVPTTHSQQQSKQAKAIRPSDREAFLLAVSGTSRVDTPLAVLYPPPPPPPPIDRSHEQGTGGSTTPRTLQSPLSLCLSCSFHYSSTMASPKKRHSEPSGAATLAETASPASHGYRVAKAARLETHSNRQENLCNAEQQSPRYDKPQERNNRQQQEHKQQQERQKRQERQQRQSDSQEPPQPRFAPVPPPFPFHQPAQYSAQQLHSDRQQRRESGRPEQLYAQESLQLAGRANGRQQQLDLQRPQRQQRVDGRPPVTEQQQSSVYNNAPFNKQRIQQQGGDVDRRHDDSRSHLRHQHARDVHFQIHEQRQKQQLIQQPQSARRIGLVQQRNHDNGDEPLQVPKLHEQGIVHERVKVNGGQLLLQPPRRHESSTSCSLTPAPHIAKKTVSRPLDHGKADPVPCIDQLVDKPLTTNKGRLAPETSSTGSESRKHTACGDEDDFLADDSHPQKQQLLCEHVGQQPRNGEEQQSRQNGSPAQQPCDSPQPHCLRENRCAA